ncbi:MAG: lipocalin-like domain-containing protein, partial [Planctomycetales bacterium]|nr:lipocalin-like domain-containing protein [Planctomycetales bacterium]
VTAALNPNMIGTDQVRHVELSGPNLVLSATEQLAAGRGSRFHRLAWRRTTIA